MLLYCANVKNRSHRTYTFPVIIFYALSNLSLLLLLLLSKVVIHNIGRFHCLNYGIHDPLAILIVARFLIALYLFSQMYSMSEHSTLDQAVLIYIVLQLSLCLSSLLSFS